MKWTERIGQRNAGNEKAVPWWVNDKYKLHKWAIENDLPMPKLLQVWKTPDELELAELPNRFVLKPSVMFSAKGVMLLEKLSNGNYWDSLGERELTVESIHREQQKTYEQCKYKGSYRLLAEERVESTINSQQIPFDYKIHSFYGEAHLVQQINRNSSPVRYAFFDGNFEKLDLDRAIISDWKKRPQDDHLKPDAWEEMLEIGKAVSRLLITPFMRVDMFLGANGPIIGELTPSPGDAFYRNNYTYTAEFDEELGRHWDAAAARIADEQ